MGRAFRRLEEHEFAGRRLAAEIAVAQAFRFDWLYLAISKNTSMEARVAELRGELASLETLLQDAQQLRASAVEEIVKLLADQNRMFVAQATIARKSGQVFLPELGESGVSHIILKRE